MKDKTRVICTLAAETSQQYCFGEGNAEEERSYKESGPELQGVTGRRGEEFRRRTCLFCPNFVISPLRYLSSMWTSVANADKPKEFAKKATTQETATKTATMRG